MKGASINRVYLTVQAVCNSNNRGYPTVSQFNQFAVDAQQEEFQEQLASFDQELRKQRLFTSHSKGAYDSIQQIRDTLSPLLRVSTSLTGSSNVMDLPDNLAYSLDFEVSGRTATIVPPDKARSRINSFLGAPTDARPIVIVDGTTATFYPSTLTTADELAITYYKYPQGTNPISGAASTSNPTWAYNTVNNVAVYSAANSVDFELPKSLEYRLAQRILSYVGINMREPEIEQFAQLKEQEETINTQ